MHTVQPSRRAVSLLAIALVAGCSPAASTPTPGSSGPPAGGSAAPPASPSTGPAPSPSTSTTGSVPKAWLLVHERGSDELHLVMTSTGEIDQMGVPDGAPAANWRRVVTATADGTATVVRDEIVQPGGGGPELRIDGQWHLPTVGLDSVPAGRSLDGSTLVLVEPPDATPGRSRFAIVEHWLLDAVQTAGDAPFRLARIIDLPGAFTYDALSPDGRILYVIQHLEPAEGGHYQVRAIDVPTGVMRDAVIVDKANPDEWMAGYPIAQVRRTDGVVMTLYDGPEHPFVHALQSSEVWALCIDLPQAAGARRSAWGLTAGADGRTVYAANGASGLVVELNPAEFAIARTTTLRTTSASAGTGIVLAKFGHSDVGPVGQRVVALPDDKGLLVAVGDGVAIVNGKDFREVGRIALGRPIVSIGVTPDGSTAFALTNDGRILAFEPRTSGRVFGAVPGDEYDRLLAVAPW